MRTTHLFVLTPTQIWSVCQNRQFWPKPFRSQNVFLVRIAELVEYCYPGFLVKNDYISNNLTICNVDLIKNEPSGWIWYFEPSGFWYVARIFGVRFVGPVCCTDFGPNYLVWLFESKWKFWSKTTSSIKNDRLGQQQLFLAKKYHFGLTWSQLNVSKTRLE